MSRDSCLRWLALALGAALVPLAQPATVLAAPANDDFAAATVIASLPFSDSVDTTSATSAADDPVGNCGNNGSVWYTFTPTQTGMVVADTLGSDYPTTLSVYTGARGALTFVTCSQDFSGPRVGFLAIAGTTYFLMAGMCCGQGQDGGGHLLFHAAVLSPPANDRFADATQVPSLPFSDTVDTLGASLESGEPTASCDNFPLAGSAWYSFTPAANFSLRARTSDQFSFGSTVAIYRGATLSALTEVGCNSFGSPLLAPLRAGATYHIQVGGNEERGPITLDLEVAPPPVAGFFTSPSDPSVFDTITFGDQSFDPAQGVITARAWTLGDGTTASSTFVTHRYAADGDYTATLTVTTADGRTATTSKTVRVRTHDVAIAGFSVPTSARAGQTKTITVQLSNKRYPETVEVQLLKSSPGGAGPFVAVGTVTVAVPVLSGNRTTSVSFQYMFTGDDATVGKVTFQAVAVLQTFRDALPADNLVTAPITRVGPARTTTLGM